MFTNARGRRFAGGANALVSCLLALVLVGMLNYLAFRHLRTRWDLSSAAYYALSSKTLNLLHGMGGELRIYTLFKQNEVIGDEVKRLLGEYEYAVSDNPGLRLIVEHVDPDRDLVRTRDLATQFDIEEANVVIVTYGGRHRVVGVPDIVDLDRTIDFGQGLGQGQPVRVHVKKKAFRGELAISSAISSLYQQKEPRVYILEGHGERNFRDFGGSGGYGGSSRLMRRESIALKPLILPSGQGVPEDCDLLVIAGPQRRLAQAEVDAVGAYLERSGRVLVMVDPEFSSGLEPLLERWGIRVGHGVVVGMTLTGRELFVTKYGDHPLTRPLEEMATMFYRPCPVEPIKETDGVAGLAADVPQVTALAESSESGWVERNLAQSPARYDEGEDRRGSASIAVAAERGPKSGISMELRPARLVVIGDSDFASNGALKSGIGGNADFLLNAINWLLERNLLLAISPKPPNDLRLDLDSRRMQQAQLILVGGVPGLAALFGLWVWVRRRR